MSAIQSLISSGILVCAMIGNPLRASPDDLRLTEFAPPVSLRDRGQVDELALQYRLFLRDLQEKDGDKKVFAQTRRGIWPQYLRRSDAIGLRTLKGALEYMADTLDGISVRLRAGRSVSLRTPEVSRFLETHRALLLNFKNPLRRRYSAEYGIYRFVRDQVSHPLVRGDREASNVSLAEGVLSDPPNSSFWANPREIARKDLAMGFDRAQSLPQLIAGLPDFCEYLEAKSNWGTHPGATLKCGDAAVKVKFGEIHSEPFASRVFWALGYNVEAVDYSPGIEFKYDRRFFKDINARIQLRFDITALGFKVGDYNITRVANPFRLLVGAVLKSGERIDAQRLERLLIRSRKPDFERLTDADFDAAGEAQLVRVITRPVQLQLKTENSDDLVKVGPWDWSELDHGDRRELRGMTAPAVWLAWYDSRFDNNRVLLVRDPRTGEMRMKHLLSDLGGSLGGAEDYLSIESDSLAKFSDRATRRSPLRGFLITNFVLIDPNRAFADATDSDFLWGLKWLNQFTREQIWDAARAAGYSAAGVVELERKLESRLRHMNEDARP